MSEQPNARFDHVFVVLRHDPSASAAHESEISVTKVLWTEDAARTEVERLNRLNSGKGCRYSYQLGRLDKRP